VKLTKAQRAALTYLASHPAGQEVASEQHFGRRTANRLAERGLIVITETCGEWFDCLITEAARSALASPDSGGNDGKASGLAGEPEGGRGR
jgi:hypothetical protein